MVRRIALNRRLAAILATAGLAIVALPLLLANRLRRSTRTPARILLLEPWGIGDLVLATGALRALRAAFPEARIDVLAKSYAKSLVIGPEMADGVVVYDFPWTAFHGKYRLTRYRFRELWELVSQLRRARYDVVLNARADVRNNLLGALIGGGRFVSVSCGFADFLATEVVQPRSEAHRSDDWRMVVERLSGPAPLAAKPRLAVDEALRLKVAASLGVTGTSRTLVIGIHPGARIAIRRWGIERFAAVGDAISSRLGARLLVFAEPDGYGSDIPLRSPFVVVKRPLPEMVAALAACDLLICNDSGPMHIASALGVPVVALFGPTRLEWFGPRGGRSRIVRIEHVACRPCFDECRYAEPHCMTRLTEAAVLEAVMSMLDEANVPGHAHRAPSPAERELPVAR